MTLEPREKRGEKQGRRKPKDRGRRMAGQESKNPNATNLCLISYYEKWERNRYRGQRLLGVKLATEKGDPKVETKPKTAFCGPPFEVKKGNCSIILLTLKKEGKQE